MHPLLLLPLAPLLLLQGLYVRKVTPRLPEPPGPRSGELGDGQPLRLLILGDSAAAGVGAATQSDGLSGQLIQKLKGSYRISWKLWAGNGRTSAQCLALLDAHDAETFDTVVISLGVNDVTSGVSLAAWQAQQAQLADLLRGKFAAKRILFTALPPMHHFPALPQPLRHVLGVRAKTFNRVLQAFVSTRDDCRLLQFGAPMQAEFMAVDGFHPSAVTYGLWAEQAAKALIAAD
ncbi:SGNH/GDSL hydrolase family protein [Arenimonas sp. GDDSR-1]|uniref:SGNH/GDSL hydrolase family protein n=1 Tax=Arenimonas sp. GDDSR-1 TaxID=2950125 RepID=UPI0026120481|nr:SGNH/GDSL hydrolase family protein [Arenimonas sp. GDDSR-1]